MHNKCTMFLFLHVVIRYINLFTAYDIPVMNACLLNVDITVSNNIKT